MRPRRFVYHLHDSAGALLYVGSSKAPKQRLAIHRRTPWGDQIEKMTTYGPYDGRMAFTYETVDIRKFRPLHNRMPFAWHEAKQQRDADRQDLILQILREKASVVSIGKIATAADCTPGVTVQVLKRLKRQGLVRAVDPTSWVLMEESFS